MKKTQTGLRYLIYKAGSGRVPQPGSKVAIRYRVNLLTGDQVYETGHSTIFTFELGKRDVISGLEEGVMLMNKGSSAKLIVPSHLAFGLLGDQEKIPTRAVLVYDVELIEINN
jgi:FKBP-type peptidyl-prolyl cis-trans isomerase